MAARLKFSNSTSSHCVVSLRQVPQLPLFKAAVTQRVWRRWDELSWLVPFLSPEKEKKALMKRQGCYWSGPGVQMIAIKTLAQQSPLTFLSFLFLSSPNLSFTSAMITYVSAAAWKSCFRISPHKVGSTHAWEAHGRFFSSPFPPLVTSHSVLFQTWEVAFFSLLH